MMARKAVSEYIDLMPGYVVHHKDGDTTNNQLANLAVYRSNSDHMTMHHGGLVRPIWDGDRPEALPI